MAPYLELKPTQESIAKAKEEQAAKLGTDEQFKVTKEPFLITDYSPGDAGHYKVSLFGKPHPDLGDEVYLWPEHFQEFPQLLKVLQSTVLKKDPKKQSSELAESQLKQVSQGQLIVIKGAGEVVNKCVAVTLVTDDGKEEEWWAYLGDKGSGHVSLVGTEPENQPKDEQPKKEKDRGKLFNVPGIGKVYANDPIIPGGSFFYYEAFRPDGHRIPRDPNLAKDVIKGAEVMGWIKQKLGGIPICITSWHRPRHINSQVGGSSASFHVRSCSAIDWYPVGMTVTEAYRRLEPWWGSRGGFAQRPKSFIHVDRRGYRARWTY